MYCGWLLSFSVFFFQAEDGIRDLVRSRGLGDVYKRQQLQQPEVKQFAEQMITDHTRAMEQLQAIAGKQRGLSLIHI